MYKTHIQLISLIHNMNYDYINYISFIKNEWSGKWSLYNIYDKKQTLFYSRVVGPYSLDVVTSSSFSVDIDSINNADDPFVTNIKKFFQFNMFNPLFLLIRMLLLILENEQK